MVEVALAGGCLAYVWEDPVVGHLRSWALVRCLENWCPALSDLSLYYPSRRHLSGGFRLVIEALRTNPLSRGKIAPARPSDRSDPSSDWLTEGDRT